MEHGKDYYLNFIALIEDACQNQRYECSYDEGVALVGDYWVAVVNFLADSGLACANYGSLRIFQLPPLIPVLADCRAMLASIAKAEADRELANREKEENIRYGRMGCELAEKNQKLTKWGIFFTAAVAIGQWIIMIVQSLLRS